MSSIRYDIVEREERKRTIERKKMIESKAKTDEISARV